MSGCCKYQLFKDRKQITTPQHPWCMAPPLLQISVIQRSKANHNEWSTSHYDQIVVANISYSKIESKSQPETKQRDNEPVVANISYSKIESKSQRGLLPLYLSSSCCKYQLFKDRKQITTEVDQDAIIQPLLQISVIQRSKANHNFETLNASPSICCCKYQLFKDRKQITTRLCRCLNW